MAAQDVEGQHGKAVTAVDSIPWTPSAVAIEPLPCGFSASTAGFVVTQSRHGQAIGRAPTQHYVNQGQYVPFGPQYILPSGTLGTGSLALTTALGINLFY